MKELVERFADEKMTKKEFIAAASKKINDSKFVNWLAECVDFGSIETYEEGIKEYNRKAEIEKTAKFLADNAINASDSVKVIEKKVATKKVYNKSAILKRAWQVAREGQKRFGGKVREYLSASMKIAWAEAK